MAECAKSVIHSRGTSYTISTMLRQPILAIRILHLAVRTLNMYAKRVTTNCMDIAISLIGLQGVYSMRMVIQSLHQSSQRSIRQSKDADMLCQLG